MIRFLVFALCLFSFSAQGAEVKKLLKKSKKVVISEGKNTGYVKGLEVCIYGENDEQLHCATIYKAKKKKSYIKIRPKSDFPKIKKGMTIKPKDPAVLAAMESKGSGGSGPKAATNVKLGYLLTPMTPSQYNMISYADSGGSQVNTVWEAEKTANISLFGFGGEVGFSLFGSKVVIGGRFRQNNPYNITANYTTDTTRYAETTVAASSFGFYFDFNYLTFEMGDLIFDIGNGLDIDSHSLVFDTDAKSDVDDEVTDLYDSVSSAMTISLRTNFNVAYFFNPFGIQLGTSLLIPLVTSTSDSITATDSEADSNLAGSTPEEDLRQAIGHDKSSIGLEMLFSAFWAF